MGDKNITNQRLGRLDMMLDYSRKRARNAASESTDNRKYNKIIKSDVFKNFIPKSIWDDKPEYTGAIAC